MRGSLFSPGRHVVELGVATLYLAIGLSYLVIGIVLALFYTYILRRRFAGSVWGAAIVAIVGAFLGGVIDLLFSDIIARLSAIRGVLNIFPPLITAIVALHLFAGLSEHKDSYDR